MSEHVHCKLIKAWADGRSIQYAEDGRWIDCGADIKWWVNVEYRVKPEKVIKYIAVNVVTDYTTRLYDSRADCINNKTYDVTRENWQVIEIEVTVP